MHLKHNRKTSQCNGKSQRNGRTHNRSSSAVNEIDNKSSPRQPVIVIPACSKDQDCFVSQSTTLPNTHPAHKAGNYKHAKKFNNDGCGKMSPVLIKHLLTSHPKSKQSSGSKEINKRDKKYQHLFAAKKGEKIIIRDNKIKEYKHMSPNLKNHCNSKQFKHKSKSNDLLKKVAVKNEQTPENKQKKDKKNDSVSWKIVFENFMTVLNEEQILELKEYKQIYFLGKIPQRTTRPLIKQIQKNINDNQEEAEGEFYKYQIGDHIAYRYEIIESINRGSFGEVIKVFDHKWKEQLALKIVKKSQEIVAQTFVQISILTNIKQKDRNNASGVVRIKDFTIFRNHICIVFQLLSGNLYQLLHANQYKGLDQQVVRIFAVQILNSLSFLRKEGVIHCDIKPENVVLRTWGRSGLKLIDFGTSCLEGKQIYQYLQSRYYRAPQIIARLPYSFPIDMWSFACLIAELRIGLPLFAGGSNSEQILYMINALGSPNPTSGSYSYAFFNSQEFQEIRKKQYLQQYHRLQKLPQMLKMHQFFSNCKHLSHSMCSLEDRFKDTDPLFVDFLRKLLVWEPNQRLLPSEALQMPWIQKGLPQQIRQLYSQYPSSTQAQPLLKNKPQSHSFQMRKTKEQKLKQKNSIVKVSNKIEGANRKSRNIELATKKKKEKSFEHHLKERNCKQIVNYNGIWSEM